VLNKRSFIYICIFLIALTFVSPVNAQNWEAVNYSDPDSIRENSLSIEEFNNLTQAEWLELLGDKEKVNFAFRAIDSTGGDITSEVDSELTIIVTGDIESSVVQFPDMKYKNMAPVISKINDQTINELDNFVLQVKATDINNDKLVYSLINKNELPLNLNMDQNGLIEWNTGYEDKGIYPLEIEVSDGDLSDTESFNLTVKDVNAPPQLSELATQETDEGGLLEFQIPANDIDNDILTFDSSNLPEGANLSVDGLFSWQPGYTNSGSHTFTVSVSDGVDTVSKDYQVSVIDKNAAPQFINLENQTIVENDVFIYQLNATDIDNDQLTYSILNTNNLPAGITINNGLIEWVTDYDSQGNYDLEVQVSDGELINTSILNLVINDVENYVLSFDGVNDYADLGKSTVGDGAFSIEFWVKTDGMSGGRFIAKDNHTLTSGYDGSWGVQPKDNGTRFFYRGNLDTSYESLDGSMTINDNSWHHIVAVRNPNNNTRKIYIDGVLDIEFISNDVALFSSLDNITIGGELPDSFESTFSKFAINELRIWSKNLSQSQIQENMTKKLTGNEEGLIAYYDMDEGSGDTLIDKAGNNNGTIYGAKYILK
jgi:hypothetical protein